MVADQALNIQILRRYRADHSLAASLLLSLSVEGLSWQAFGAGGARGGYDREGAPKVEKARGRRERPTNFGPSMWIVCHEALRAGPVERSWLLPNPVRRRLAEYRRWTNGGRKVGPTDQFRPPHWRSIGYAESHAVTRGCADAARPAPGRRRRSRTWSRFGVALESPRGAPAVPGGEQESL